MKTDIQPKTQEIKAVCACGATFTVTSTLDHDIQLDVCSQCHPFYTGKQNMIDTAGRVDKFRERANKTSSLMAARKPKKAKIKTPKAPVVETAPEETPAESAE